MKHANIFYSILRGKTTELARFSIGLSGQIGLYGFPEFGCIIKKFIINSSIQAGLGLRGAYMDHWDIFQSKHIYRLKQWGEGLFDINQKGELTVSPDLKQYDPVSLYSIARELKNYDLSFPVLLRFPDILQQRIQRLYNAFAAAMRKADYCADYTPVYPIKVNQQRSVVESVLDSGQAGLEAGSKAEMMAILALSPPEGTIITCNGYKDCDYIRLYFTPSLPELF